jgi:small neutral amino acid transporter SnatA (MarC family)
LKDATLKRTVTVVLFVGLALVLTAIYLALVPKLQSTMGMQGVSIIAGVAGLGLVLMLPAKIMLTLWLMTKSGKNVGDQNEGNTS